MDCLLFLIALNPRNQRFGFNFAMMKNKCELSFSKISDPRPDTLIRWTKIQPSVWEQLNDYLACFFDSTEFSLYKIHKEELLRLLGEFLFQINIKAHAHCLDESMVMVHVPVYGHDKISTTEPMMSLGYLDQEDDLSQEPEIVSTVTEIPPTESERHCAMIHLLNVLKTMRKNYCNSCQRQVKETTYCFHKDQIGFSDYYTIRCGLCGHDHHGDLIYEVGNCVDLFRPNPFLLHGDKCTESEILGHLLEFVMNDFEEDDNDDNDGSDDDIDSDDNYKKCDLIELDTFLCLLSAMPLAEDIWCIVKVRK